MEEKTSRSSRRANPGPHHLPEEPLRGERLKADRERTKGERDTRIARLEQKVAEHDRMMAEGNDRFDRIERELKETNGLLRELVGIMCRGGVTIGSTALAHLNGTTC